MIKWLDENRIIRKLTMMITVGMTVYALMWSLDFASVSNKSGGDIALIIGAIMTPLSALQGFALNFYIAAERSDAKDSS